MSNEIAVNGHKPKLLVATTTFPRWENDAGPAPFVFDLAIHLQKYFEITVLAPHFPGAAEHEVWKGMEVCRFRYLPDNREKLADGQGLQNHLRKRSSARYEAMPFMISEYLAGRRLLKDRKFDAVNSHWLVPSGLIFARLAKHFKTRHIVTVHAADYFMLNKSSTGRWLMRRIARSSQAVIPVNQMMADGIKKLWPSARTHVMPMGFDPQRFREVEPGPVAKLRQELSLQGKKIILYVGKLTEKKGLRNLLEAVKILGQDMDNFQLLIVGGGGWKPHLERMASKLNVTYRVRFAGRVPHREVPFYYQLADVVALPAQPDKHGETEGMPVVILEALASGKPVVGTSYCSAPEPLKQGGFIEIKEPTPAEIAAGLRKALSGDFRADFKAVDNYSWEQVAKFYSEVIAGG